MVDSDEHEKDKDELFNNELQLQTLAVTHIGTLNSCDIFSKSLISCLVWNRGVGGCWLLGARAT